MAEQIAPGDRIVFMTGVQAFGGIVRVTGEMFEDREKIWPGKPGRVDPYPWRFPIEPGGSCWTRTSSCPPPSWLLSLEHVRKWPLEHWQLAFQASSERCRRPTRGCSRAASAKGLARQREPLRWLTCRSGRFGLSGR